jgi:NADPH:quinone reductase-like Zn-dependent oxidoreductase
MCQVASVFTIYNRKSVSNENAGVIDAVGEDVVGWAVGDAVLYHGSAFYIFTTVFMLIIHTDDRLLVSPIWRLR